MSEPINYNLSDLTKNITQKWPFILSVCIAAIITGVIARLIIPEKYEAETVLIVKNPLYSDRNNLYNNETKFIDYFSSEDDIDKFITMAESDSVQNRIIQEMNLATAYKMDTTDPEDVFKLRKLFNKRLKLYRTENKNVVLAYTDIDPKRAATLTNRYVTIAENAFRGFYTGIRKGLYQTLMNKIKDEDSAINLMTDSLVVMREKYGIYDIISPSRYNIMLSTIKNNGKEGYAKGIELIQNIESIKDELVSDRSRHLTLANQYSTGISDEEMHLTQVVKVAKVPVKPKGVDMAETIIGAGILGIIFSMMYILVALFLKNVRRPH